LKNTFEESGGKCIEAHNHLEEARQRLLKRYPIVRRDVDFDDLKNKQDKQMLEVSKRNKQA
jgi:hypothetical protein